MNAEVLTILTSYGNSAIDQIKQNLSGSGTNATGKSARSLRVEVTESGTKASLKIFAKPFFMVVETGRKPTPEYKPSKTFVSSIQEWMTAKGKTGSAYAIAQSIHKKGTKLWQTGGRKDIVSNVINEAFVDKIAADLLETFGRVYLTEVVKTFKDGSNSNQQATRA